MGKAIGVRRVGGSLTGVAGSAVLDDPVAEHVRDGRWPASKGGYRRRPQPCYSANMTQAYDIGLAIRAIESALGCCSLVMPLQATLTANIDCKRLARSSILKRR